MMLVGQPIAIATDNGSEASTGSQMNVAASHPIESFDDPPHPVDPVGATVRHKDLGHRRTITLGPGDVAGPHLCRRLATIRPKGLAE
jgi:hypothetical protein